LLAKKGRSTGLAALLCAAMILFATVATSHSAARLEDRGLLLLLTGAHQTATAAWIGGLPFLLLALAAASSVDAAHELCRRFSRLAFASVVVLFGAGLVLAYFYVGSAGAVYGTTYGVMLVSKIILFGMVLAFGAVNYRTVRQLAAGNPQFLLRLKRLGEVEIGIGITAILAAASLTSQPPAADLVRDRVSLSTIASRMTPHWPRMTTPPLSSLSPSSREEWKQAHPVAVGATQAFVPGQSYTPPTQGDIEWSEYNHHWAGIVVLAAGLLAILSRFGNLRPARHWPLAFLGLAAFLLLRADPENWPLGPSGFWESFTTADVAQHRFFVVLIVLFAVFEWRVQTKPSSSQNTALVFPLICAAGGALLLTHTHALTNVKESLLAELSHVPIALLGVTAGWARWLELRLPGSGRDIAGRVWPVSFLFIGVVLVLYREA
jgi:putative copper resistance protein D